MVNNNVDTEDSESDSSSSDDESEKSGSDTEADSTPEITSVPEVNLIEEISNNHEKQDDDPKVTMKIKEEPLKGDPKKSNLDLLLDLDDLPAIGQSIMTPSLGGFLTPIAGGGLPGPPVNNKIELVGPSWCPLETQEMLNKVNGYGLGIKYKYNRSPHLFSASMVSLELQFMNHKEGNVTLEEIQVRNFTIKPLNNPELTLIS